MKFLALIIALALFRYWGSAGPMHRDEWFKTLVGKVNGSGLVPEVQLAFAVLVPAALLFWLQLSVQGVALGLLSLALAVVVLLYSFGRGNFEAMLGRYREYCRAGDFEAAFLFAREELSDGCEEECPSGPEKLHRWVKERICYLGFERWFGVIFYFALAGAAGALAYRLLHLYPRCDGDESRQRLVSRVLYWVDWVPARLLVFTFAVTGDWVGSREQLASSWRDMESGTGEMLADSAHAALGLKATVFSADSEDTQAFSEVSDWEIGQLDSLISRSAVAWIAALALLVLLD